MFICLNAYMISGILSAIITWIIHVISTLGYPGVVLLMALHSAAIPVPSEVVMPFSGFLAASGRFNFWLVVIYASLGNLLGASFIYWLSQKGGRKLILSYENKLFISQRELEKVEKFFDRFGAWAILIGRCIPVVATFISIPAGLGKVKYWKFALLTLLGATVWNIVLTFIGYKLGQNWMLLKDRLHNFDILIVATIVIVIIWWVWRHVRKNT